MPRLRRPEVAAGRGVRGVPAELADLDSEAWATTDATLAWLEAHALDSHSPHVKVERLGDGPRTRHKVAATAWAVAQGHVNPWGYPMLSTLREQGIPLSNGAALERLAAADVKFKAE